MKRWIPVGFCWLYFQIPSTEDVRINTFYFEDPAWNHGAYIFTLPFYVRVFDVNRNFIRACREIKDMTQYLTLNQEQE